MSRPVPVVAAIALVIAAIGVSPAAIQPSQAADWGFIRLENVLSADDLRIAHPGAVAYDAKTRHTFTLDAKAGVLVESDRSGIVVSRRNVAGLKLQGVAGMAIRPTVDTTDAAGATSLYLSVANASDDGAATGPAILELALAEPVVAEALAGIPDNVGHKVKEIDTTGPTWDPFSPDPSGIAYANSTGKLVVVDGEIEEEHVNNYPYPGQQLVERRSRDRAPGTGSWTPRPAAPPTRSRSESPTTPAATSSTSRGTAAAPPCGRTHGVETRGPCGTSAS